MQPTREQWIALYEAASAFKDQASWEWLTNGHIFGIENPVDGGLGYISILGNGGEAFGLSVYLGTEGIHVLMDMLNGEVEEDPLFTQHCLLMALNDREDLYPEERKKIKELGLTFRGKKAWPAFLYYEPGFVPSPELSGAQAEFLTLALRQTMALAGEFRNKPDELFHDDPTKILVRCPSDEGQAWTKEWRSLPELPGEESNEQAAIRVDELRLARMKKTITSREAVWEIDCSYVPIPLMEGERGVFPKLMMLVDQASGQILKAALSNRREIVQETVDSLLAVMESSTVIPSRIEALTEEAFRYVGPLLQYFEIEAYLTTELPALEEAKDSMMAGLLANRE